MKKVYKLVEFRPMTLAENLSREDAVKYLKQEETDNPEFRYMIVEQNPPREAYMIRYPRIVAHIICESLGYATPTVAAMILKDAAERRENYCEWIDACYNKSAISAVKSAISRRKYHQGYMAEYENAIALVRHAIQTGKEPMLASWF